MTNPHIKTTVFHPVGARPSTLVEFSESYKAQLAEAANVISTLPEDIRDTFIENVHALLRAGRLVFSKTSDGPTPGTCHGTISFEVLGMDEVIAAARLASNR